MTVQDTITMLNKTINELSKMDPNQEIEGHVAEPDGCYGGDMDGSIYEMEVVTQDQPYGPYLTIKY